MVDSPYRSTLSTRLWCNLEVATALEMSEQLARGGGRGKGRGKERGAATSDGTDDVASAKLAGQDPKRKYDVYALDAVSKKVIGLTDGLAAVDEGCAGAQARRQRPFPTSVLHAMCTVRVQDGSTTLPSDRVHILNSIVGASDLNGPPEVSAPP